MIWRYPNKKCNKTDGFTVTCASAKETGLPYDILLDSLGLDKRFSGKPRVGVLVEDTVVPVSISEKPVVLSGYHFQNEIQIIKWIEKHNTELLDHWNKKLSDKKKLNSLCCIKRKGIAK